MSPIPLTRRQHQILDFFQGYAGEHGISPTLEEIARHFGLNKVTIFGHVSELERKGILKRAAPNISRGLQIVPSRAPTARRGAVEILGTIAAGAPIEVAEQAESLALEDWVPEGTEVYALRVRGDSMIEDAICDGDLVLVEARHQARDGEIVVAILPGEQATLKRLYHEKAGGYLLKPANSTMAPIRCSEVEIRGVVIGVLRRL